MAISSVIGKNKSWNLIQKLGEGDAGEVYLVEAILDQRQAVLKRPRKSAFSSDITRQAAQIRKEGEILSALNGLRPYLSVSKKISNVNIRAPLLLDRSDDGTEFSDRYFIVVEKASGFDFNVLAKTVRHTDSASLDSTYLRSLAECQDFPILVLLFGLASVLHMFEAIHKLNRVGENSDLGGIIWNDVKPEHLFWDPQADTITIIDWGNAQTLEADGFTKDRRYSRNNDYAQLLQTFSLFIQENKPELLSQIAWPETFLPSQNLKDLVIPLQKKIHELILVEKDLLASAYQKETDIIDEQNPEKSHLETLFAIQNEIIRLGGIPDYRRAETFCTNLANQLVSSGNFSEFSELSKLTCHLHEDKPLKWAILAEIANHSTQADVTTIPALTNASYAGLVEDWASTLWELKTAFLFSTEPVWMTNLVDLLRQVGLGLEPNQPTPLVALRRIIFTIQTQLQTLIDRLAKPSPVNSSNQLSLGDNGNEQSSSDEDISNKIKALENLIRLLRDEIANKWEELEPDPPDSGLEYSDLKRLLNMIQDPKLKETIIKITEQPASLVDMILSAWDNQDFDRARRGLRTLCLWDPQRQRVFLADRAIARSPAWLERIRLGPDKDSPTIDFVTELEIDGREIRNQVGTAAWLDLILETLAYIRKGKKTNELLVEKPEIIRLLPWLGQIDPRRYVPSQPARPILMDREKTSYSDEPLLQGIQEGSIGVDQDILLTDPLDTWAPEARGSSARAFTSFIRNLNGQLKQVALKIMRPDRLDYSLPLFREEVLILNLMKDVPGVTPLLECGFIRFDENLQIPADHQSIGARSMKGVAQRFSPDQATSFLTVLEQKAHQGWLPYLVIRKLDNKENLMWLCDSGYTRGQFIPIEESLRLALQICDILQVAHARKIVYRDHKLLHYYWSELYNGVFMIDWNVARYHPGGLSLSEIKFDLVQLGARAFHHIFTGRVAPGALADGPNRVEEIENAAQSYRTQWTYDDQRLPPALKQILENILAGEYDQIQSIRDELSQLYFELIAEEIN